jgi:N-acetylglucosaminyl-diphospho-decaprenol L-rhamnosyltransferase
MPGLTSSLERRIVPGINEPGVDAARSRMASRVDRLTSYDDSPARGMEPLTIDRTHILVLNYNGQAELEECMPSLLAAAARSPVPCAVSVVDNGSTDGSCAMIAGRWPSVGIIHQPNRGLASFNAVLEKLDEPVVLLLNSDVKLDANAVGPLIDIFRDRTDALFSAPLCWTFDGRTYEGMRTRVRSRYGMVQGMSRVPGHQHVAYQEDLTAAAGPVLAVDRQRFLEIGGYDPLYFPGRIEDLDLGFRGWMAGLRGYYVPGSVAYHKGFATFGRELGMDRCDRLAERNTLIFVWKNTSGARLVTHAFWLGVRVMASLVRGRLGFARSLCEALRRAPEILAARRSLEVGRGNWVERQERFYQRFQW